MEGAAAAVLKGGVRSFEKEAAPVLTDDRPGEVLKGAAAPVLKRDMWSSEKEAPPVLTAGCLGGFEMWSGRSFERGYGEF